MKKLGRSYISYEMDVEDALNQIDDDDIVDYCMENNMISLEDFAYNKDNVTTCIRLFNDFPIDILSDKNLLDFIKMYMNRNTVNMIRSKKEIIDFITELVENNL